MNKVIFIVLALIFQAMNSFSQDVYKQIAIHDSSILAIDSGKLYTYHQVSGASPIMGSYQGFVYKKAGSNEISKMILVFSENEAKIYCIDTVILRIYEDIFKSYDFFGRCTVSKQGILVTDREIINRLNAYKEIFNTVNTLLYGTKTKK